MKTISIAIAAATLLLAGSAAYADSAAALKALDPDNDGTIDLKEAEAGAAKVFKAINPDGDTTLEADELEGRVDAAGLKANDPDDDASLDEKEYMALVKKQFEAANPDNDGTVDLKELEFSRGSEAYEADLRIEKPRGKRDACEGGIR